MTGGAGDVRLLVDPIACTAHGLCAAWLPERVVLDEWGYPIIAAEPLPTHLVAAARRAAAQCPVRALRVDRVDPAAAQVSTTRMGSPARKASRSATASA